MKQPQKELFRWADQIPDALWSNLRNRSPQHAAEMVGAKWDGKTFKVPMIGVNYIIDLVNQTIIKDYKTDRAVSYQAGVVLLTTLTTSKGVPPSNRMTVPQELPGGQMFFIGAHSLATGPLTKNFEKDSNKLINRILEFGGEMIEGADVAIRIPGLPYVPLNILMWHRNHEVDAIAVIGIDDRAHFHLDLAGVFALTNIFVNRLCKDIGH